MTKMQNVRLAGKGLGDRYTLTKKGREVPKEAPTDPKNR